MKERYCPICKLVPINRPEIKTCGSKPCLTAWRQMLPEQKAKAIANEDVIVDLEFLKPKSDGSLPSLDEAIELQRKAEAIGRGEGFLDSVFGTNKDKSKSKGNDDKEGGD